MRQNTLETILGVVIIIGAALFAFTVYNSANLTPSDGIELKADFGNVSGLSSGDDVFLAGIKIGQVTSHEIDKITYMARLKFRINCRQTPVHGLLLNHFWVVMCSSSRLEQRTQCCKQGILSMIHQTL
jgi:ABC-type transporter Mla subunit MlaD